MATKDRVPLDRLAHKHELMPYDPDDAERTQVLAVEHGGRTLEVIVPFLFDDTRVGEVVAAAVSGETVFLLGRFDRQYDDHHGTLGLLVVAVPHGEGRYRAAIAHTTYSLDGDGWLNGLGLYPAPGAGDKAVTPPRVKGPDRGRLPDLDDVRAFHRARPFRPFLILTISGGRFPVYHPDTLAISARAGSMILLTRSGGFDQIAVADIAAVREIAPDDPEAIESVHPA